MRWRRILKGHSCDVLELGVLKVHQDLRGLPKVVRTVVWTLTTNFMELIFEVGVDHLATRGKSVS